jgi:hypothetical protein
MDKGQAFAALVVALLLILTALGNALVLFAFATATLFVGFVVYRGRSIRGAVLAATAGLIMSVAIALVLLFQ